MTEELKPLSKKHQRFVDEWLQCFNGTRAYKAVYPKASYDTARVNASVLLTKTNIQAEIKGRLAAVHMQADEVLKLLADQARADIGEIMEATTFGYNFDMRKAKEIGFTRLIKKVKQKTVTILGKGEDSEDTEIHTIEIETYDAQRALEIIGKNLKLWNDPGSKENPLQHEHIIRIVTHGSDGA